MGEMSFTAPPLPVCARPWTASWMVPAPAEQGVPCEPGGKLGQGRASSWRHNQEGTLVGSTALLEGTREPGGPT